MWLRAEPKLSVKTRLPAMCMSPPHILWMDLYNAQMLSLRALTMTDRPRKDTDLSLFVGPYQHCEQQLYPPPSFSFGAPDPFRAPQQKRLSYLDNISVKFGQWNGLTGHCRRIWHREGPYLQSKRISHRSYWHDCVVAIEHWSIILALLIFEMTTIKINCIIVKRNW